MNFVDMISYYARWVPEKPAIILAERSIPYAMLTAGIDGVTETLGEKGLTRGSVVAIRIEDQLRHLIVACALYRLGIVSVTLTADGDLASSGVRLSAMVTDGVATSWRGATHVIDPSWFAREPGPICAAARGFDHKDDLCRISLSSGTTAAPKAIGFSVRVWEERFVIGFRVLSTVAWDRLLCLPSLGSNLGFRTALQTLAFGRTLLFADTPLDALRMTKLYGVDLMVANPSGLAAMVATHREHPISTPSLNMIKYGGAMLAPDLAQQVRARLCPNVLCEISSTESGAFALAPLDVMPDIPGATGYRTPWVELETVDEQRRPLPPGEDGFLRVHSGAHGRDLLRPAALPGEKDWIYTGDYGRVMPDGLVVLAGRAADVIRLADGRTIAPELIENVVATFSGVLDCAALAMKSLAGKHEIWLALKTSGFIDAAALRARLAAVDTAWTIAQIRMVDAIPRNDMGKLQRNALRSKLQG